MYNIISISSDIYLCVRRFFDSLCTIFNLEIHQRVSILFAQVCDGSRALLTACISTFTNYLVIEEYCDIFFYDPEAMRKKPFISKDVAHNMKIWIKFLSNKNRRIKVFLSSFYRTPNSEPNDRGSKRYDNDASCRLIK